MIKNPFARAVRYRDGLPILPGAFPLLGHLPLFYKAVNDFMPRMRQKLGPVFWVKVGPSTHVLTCSGPDALEVFRNKAFTSEHLTDISPLVALGTLLAQDGAAHRHTRAAMNGPFAPRGLSAKAVGAMIARVVEERAAQWAGRRRIKILGETRELALEIIFRLIGVAPEDLATWRSRYSDLLLANLGLPFMFPGSPAYRATKAKAWLDARFREIISASRAEGAPETLVRALAHAKDDAGLPLTEEELVNNLRLLVLGGHETTASTLAFMVIQLALDPELCQRAVDEATAGDGVPATPEEARVYPLADAIFRETVRTHPPFPMITRLAVDDYELYGCRIPKGAIVGVDLWSTSRDPSLYEDPDAFRPSRWLSRREPPSPREMVQFGAGAHFCLGYHLAWLECVDLTVALGRELGRRGLRPRLAQGRAPDVITLPTTRPAAKTIIELACPNVESGPPADCVPSQRRREESAPDTTG